jgi:hypothetical protein
VGLRRRASGIAPALSAAGGSALVAPIASGFVCGCCSWLRRSLPGVLYDACSCLTSAIGPVVRSAGDWSSYLLKFVGDGAVRPPCPAVRARTHRLSGTDRCRNTVPTLPASVLPRCAPHMTIALRFRLPRRMCALRRMRASHCIAPSLAAGVRHRCGAVRQRDALYQRPHRHGAQAIRPLCASMLCSSRQVDAGSCRRPNTSVCNYVKKSGGDMAECDLLPSNNQPTPPAPFRPHHFSLNPTCRPPCLITSTYVDWSALSLCEPVLLPRGASRPATSFCGLTADPIQPHVSQATSCNARTHAEFNWPPKTGRRNWAS